MISTLIYILQTDKAFKGLPHALIIHVLILYPLVITISPQLSWNLKTI